MKIRTLVIDDEPIALEKLKNYVSKVPFLELAGACQSAVDAAGVLACGNVDVIFTDINMPDIDGMEFVGSLPNPPMVVFITAYAQYAVDSYRLSAVDYLLKPYGFADFQRAANKVLEQYKSRHAQNDSLIGERNGSIFIKVDYRYVRVNLSDIRYIKGYGEYLQIYMDGSASPLLTLSSFAAIMERLPSSFLQVHRSYVVNMDRVVRIEKSRVIMDAETYIPVGDSYRTAFMDYLTTHSLGMSGQK